MGDFEDVFGEISTCFIARKPIDLDGVTCLSPADWNPLERRQEDKDWSEHDINVEIPQFQPLETIFPQEESESVWDWTSEPITLNFTIDAKSARELRKIVRYPKLPRKLKKYVKKHYFDEYPRKVSAQMLRFVFAIKNPHKAGKVGLHIGVDVSKDGDSGKEMLISTTSCTSD